MTEELDRRMIEAGCDIMQEGMAAIRNISGALRAWDLKDDATRLKTINSISEALYTFDPRSEVSMSVTRATLQRLFSDSPDLANMCPLAAAWSRGEGLR